MYRKGYRFERTTKAYLEAKGYYVIRQGGSKFPDLVAIKCVPGVMGIELLFVECKCAKYITRDERKKFVEIGQRVPYSRRAVAYVNKKARGGIGFYGIALSGANETKKFKLDILH